MTGGASVLFRTREDADQAGGIASGLLWGACSLGLMLSSCVAVSAPEETAEELVDEGTTVPSVLLSAEDDPEAHATDDDQADDDQADDDDVEPAPDSVAGRAAAPTPGAIITPTGVVVPVLAAVYDGFSVLSPCGNETVVSWGTPLQQIEVVLDPGHGGDVESGAQGLNGLVERDVNLAVAKHTARVLAERGVGVALTRTGDYRVPLSVRAAVANQLDARALVSIHHNAPVVGRSDGPGTEVFVQVESEESRRLGGLVYEEVFGALEQFDIDWVAASDAGALAVLNADGENAYGMIRRPEMPAVLAELGYLANRPEAELFATDIYVRVAGVALADAIVRWLDTQDPGSGFVDEPRHFTPNGRTGGSAGCEDPPLE